MTGWDGRFKETHVAGEEFNSIFIIRTEGTCENFLPLHLTNLANKLNSHHVALRGDIWDHEDGNGPAKQSPTLTHEEEHNLIHRRVCHHQLKSNKF